MGARLCGALGAVNTGGERSEKGQEGPQVLAMLRMADMDGRMGGSEMEEHQRKPQRGHKLLDGSAGAWSTLVPVLAPTSSAHKPRALLESPPAVPAQGPLLPPAPAFPAPHPEPPHFPVPTALPSHTETSCTCTANAPGCSSGGDSPCQLCDTHRPGDRQRLPRSDVLCSSLLPRQPWCSLPGSGTCRKELATGRCERLAFTKPCLCLLLGLYLPSLPPPREGKAAASQCDTTTAR